MIPLLFFIIIQTVISISLSLVTPATLSSFNELMNPNLKYNKLITTSIQNLQQFCYSQATNTEGFYTDLEQGPVWVDRKPLC